MHLPGAKVYRVLFECKLKKDCDFVYLPDGCVKFKALFIPQFFGISFIL
jgi:hypothetical protein